MSAPVSACQPPDPPDPHPSPASPSEADCDLDLEATVPDPMRTSTPQEPAGGPVSAPQVETVPREAEAAHGPSGGHTAPRDAHCGEECADGHTRAGRCTQRGDITTAQARAMLAAVDERLADVTTVAKLNYGLHAAAHDEAEQMRAERQTYRAAWHSARDRAAKRSHDRDQARRWAVALENQLAAVQALHVDSLTARGVVRGTSDDPNRPYCTHDSQPWPCDTVRAIDETGPEGGEQA